MKKNTCCVHGGSIRDTFSGGLNTPIFPSSSFEYLDSPETLYPRYFNTPNQRAVVRKLCALEDAEDGLLFSSGMAAVSTVIFSLLQGGDHIVFQRDIYGGTHHLATAELSRFGIDYSLVSPEPAAIEGAIRRQTRMIYIETPSNPLLTITDIDAVARIARSAKILSAIDNTFASPVNQNPLKMGIDVVIHSGTKYLGGHSDLCCGAVLTRKELADRIHATAVNLGGSLNALTCHLLERSLKTLGIRVERHNRNAGIIAEFLQCHDRVKRVHYPGLPSHPGNETAAKQMRGFGGMLSFEVDEKRVDPDGFLRRLRLIKPAVSLGGVETIICSPAATSHASLSRQERLERGISDGLLRLSVGIEDPEDLVSDLEQALAHSS